MDGSRIDFVRNAAGLEVVMLAELDRASRKSLDHSLFVVVAVVVVVAVRIILLSGSVAVDNMNHSVRKSTKDRRFEVVLIAALVTWELGIDLQN